MIITIHITSDDIKNGRRNNACECPIALSLERSSPASWVAVYETRIEIEDFDGTMWRCDPPKKTTDWIDDYDRGKTVAPTAMTFDFQKR